MNDEFVIQFRLRSLALKTETNALASSVYGSLAPRLEFCGQLGDNIQDDEKERHLVYLISRVHGTTYLGFRLANDMSSPEGPSWRMNAMQDIAK